jgi:hypothetical protein
MAAPGEDRAWWRCPNDPPCPHAGLFHDVEDFDDPSPRCCVDGCDCGGSPLGDARPKVALLERRLREPACEVDELPRVGAGRPEQVVPSVRGLR